MGLKELLEETKKRQAKEAKLAEIKQRVKKKRIAELKAKKKKKSKPPKPKIKLKIVGGNKGRGKRPDLELVDDVKKKKPKAKKVVDKNLSSVVLRKMTFPKLEEKAIEQEIHLAAEDGHGEDNIYKQTQGLVVNKELKEHVGYIFWCPGCNMVHGVFTDTEDDHIHLPKHKFNGNTKTPTFSPVISMTYDDANGNEVTCVSTIIRGRIQYSRESTHTHKGKNGKLPSVSKWTYSDI